MNDNICRLLPLMYVYRGFKQVVLPEPVGIVHVYVHKGFKWVVLPEPAGITLSKQFWRT